MAQASWLYRPPTWHPRPRRLLPPSLAAAAGTLALNGAGYEIGDGNSPATMATEVGVSFDLAVYPAAQWPFTSATLTQAGQVTDSAARLPNIVSALVATGTVYRVFIRRVSDGEVWTLTITAT